MQELKCQHCLETVPLNESLTVLGEKVCMGCAEKELESRSEISEGDVVRNMDPTICVKCGKDNGSFALEKIMTFPVCSMCAPTFTNHPFPLWIKWSALGLAVLVVLSFVLNIRFIQANSEWAQYETAMDEGDLKKAALMVGSAADHVPEIPDFRYIYHYTNGLAQLRDDTPREALESFNKCKLYLPPEYEVEYLIQRASIGLAFDEHNYDKFLELAREDYSDAPEDRMTILALASAFACKYVDTGDEFFKGQSRLMLVKYRSIDEEEDLSNYEMRILHRLYAREILPSEVFWERYPDGWINPEGDW